MTGPAVPPPNQVPPPNVPVVPPPPVTLTVHERPAGEIDDDHRILFLLSDPIGFPVLPVIVVPAEVPLVISELRGLFEVFGSPEKQRLLAIHVHLEPVYRDQGPSFVRHDKSHDGGAYLFAHH